MAWPMHINALENCKHMLKAGFAWYKYIVAKLINITENTLPTGTNPTFEETNKHSVKLHCIDEQFILPYISLYINCIRNISYNDCAS
jgi:hypothetical protein